MTTSPLHGKTALVTGASSGLGVDFARELAGLGCHLVLVARREELLRSVQTEIQERYGVTVTIVAQDLGVADAAQHLYEALARQGKTIDVLVNNAGFGVHGAFLDIPWERQQALLALDIVALVHLTRLFTADMVKRGFGYVLQVASNGAYQATPTYATYAAAKSFVLSFGEALNYELRQTKVRCTVVCPGVTATEFLAVSGQRQTAYQKLMMMQSGDVCRIGVAAMLKGKSSVIPGFLNALLAWSTRFTPRDLATAVASRMMT